MDRINNVETAVLFLLKEYCHALQDSAILTVCWEYSPVMQVHH